MKVKESILEESNIPLLTTPVFHPAMGELFDCLGEHDFHNQPLDATVSFAGLATTRIIVSIEEHKITLLTGRTGVLLELNTTLNITPEATRDFGNSEVIFGMSFGLSSGFYRRWELHALDSQFRNRSIRGNCVPYKKCTTQHAIDKLMAHPTIREILECTKALETL